VSLVADAQGNLRRHRSIGRRPRRGLLRARSRDRSIRARAPPRLRRSTAIPRSFAPPGVTRVVAHIAFDV